MTLNYLHMKFDPELMSSSKMSTRTQALLISLCSAVFAVPIFLKLITFDGKVAATTPAIIFSHKHIQGRKEKEGVVSSIKGNFCLFCQEAKALSANLSLCLVG